MRGTNVWNEPNCAPSPATLSGVGRRGTKGQERRSRGQRFYNALTIIGTSIALFQFIVSDSVSGKWFRAFWGWISGVDPNIPLVPLAMIHLWAALILPLVFIYYYTKCKALPFKTPEGFSLGDDRLLVTTQTIEPAVWLINGGDPVGLVILLCVYGLVWVGAEALTPRSTAVEDPAPDRALLAEVVGIQQAPFPPIGRVPYPPVGRATAPRQVRRDTPRWRR